MMRSSSSTTMLFRLSALAWTILLYFATGSSASGIDQYLLNSAFSNDVNGVQSALDQGANVNVQDPASRQTPLMGAILRGHTPVVKYLLQSRRDMVDVTIPEKDGYTAAHGAAFQGRPDIMHLLIQAGINVKDDFHRDGYAPLHRACWGNTARHTETLRVLRDEANVDLNMADRKDGATCREMTRNQKTLELLREQNKKDDL